MFRLEFPSTFRFLPNSALSDFVIQKGLVSQIFRVSTPALDDEGDYRKQNLEASLSAF